MVSYDNLISPREIKDRYPANEELKDSILHRRETIRNILDGRDRRKILVVGPCSIHNFDDALEYADRLGKLNEKVKDKILILMRVYLEKPRSSVGWKGFINDPFLDGSHNIEKGLLLARELLLKINEKGIGVASEFLDVLVYPYIAGLVSWAIIGARTVESQTHRQIVSGLNMPVGYKNPTSGNVEVAINAMKSSTSPHYFIGIDENGRVSKISTRGNLDCCLIMRGGLAGPNYEEEFVREVCNRLRENGLGERVVIDSSHGNSGKDYKKQPLVFRDVVCQMKDNEKIKGLMLESNLKEGNQIISESMERGISVTDSCIGWEETEKLVLEAYNLL